MPAPVIATALVNLRTRLAGINGAPTYATTITTCELLGRIWELVDDAQRPYIGIQAMTDSPQYFPSRQVKGAMQVVLVCLLPFTDDPAARIAAQHELLDDIYAAISIDHTLGVPGITSTSIAQWAVDGSDPLSVHSMKVTLIIQYRRPSGGSP